jgi:hypothetical protein
MTYRLPDLEISPDDPFRHDALDRKPIVEFLAALISRTGGPFVLALDSPWGSGKTTIVRMLEAELKRQSFQSVYFNAWQVDYVTDPLVALVSSIDQIELADEQAASSFKDHLKVVRKVTTLVAKRGAVAAAKAVTAGMLDLEAEIEKAAAEFSGNVVSDLVDSFQKEKELLSKFRSELEAAVAQLSNSGKKPTLVFFIDELDRCRPTFAIELLERIKHLFDVPNITFVLSLDKKQLEASTAAVYGQGIDAPEYLRRFIDLEYGIPRSKAKKFTENLFARFGLDGIFAERNHPELQYERGNFLDVFTELADVMSMSLRARERCMTRLRVVMDQTPRDNYLEPILIALLIVLRSNRNELFDSLCTGQAGPKDVMSYLASFPGGMDLVASRSGQLIEAFLISSDENENRRAARVVELKALAENESTAQQNRDAAKELLNFIQHAQRSMHRSPRFRFAARKVDLSAGLKD